MSVEEVKIEKLISFFHHNRFWRTLITVNRMAECKHMAECITVHQCRGMGAERGGGLSLWVGAGCFLDYSVAARGAPHQTDPVPGEPAGDVPLPELLGKLTV